MGDNSKTRIVVLGGGYAGVEATKDLARHFKGNGDVSITLIDRNPYHTLMTELHEIAGSRTEPEAVQVSFKRIFAGSKVNVVIDSIESIDFTAKRLKSLVGEYPYDYLVLGTGGRPDFFGIPGIQQHSFTLWSLEDAIRIREHIELQFRQAAKEPDEAERRRVLTFVIAGAGFTGIELVGELMERADVLCRKYHILRQEVRILVVEAQGAILPILAKKPQGKAQRYLERHGVEILLDSFIIKGEEGKYHLKDGRVLEAGTFVWTCGVQGSEFTAKIPLTKGKVANDKCSVVTPEGIHGMSGCSFDDDEQTIVGERGRILVNSHMESVDQPDVYLCGDMVWYLNQGAVVPQIVENALQSGQLVAKNIIAAMEGKPKSEYHPRFHGFMVSIGSRYAVASVMKTNLYGFFAMAMKHLVNLHYLWGLAGFNACFSYVMEEFIDIKNQRSMLHGHLSAWIPGFFALPARLWLGLVWVMEGVNKIGEGWLHFDRSRSTWMFSKGVVQAGVNPPKVAGGVQLLGDSAGSAPQVADALTAASEGAQTAAQTAGDAILNITVGANPPAQPVFGKVWDLDGNILSPDSPLVTWFRQTFMDGLAAHLNFALFQTMIVCTEVAIGLALMGGLLTFPAAAVSIGMCLVFTLSGMFTWSQLWFVFLAIVLLGGSGRSFGLDHYVMPWVRDRWASSRLAKRTFLYAGEPVQSRKTKKARSK